MDNNGRGERFSPTDTLATSLANCMITTMGIKARTMGFDLTGVKIDVLKTMKADPRPVAISLHPDIEQKVDWGEWK